jgi:hypothetical protein
MITYKQYNFFNCNFDNDKKKLNSIIKQISEIQDCNKIKNIDIRECDINNTINFILSMPNVISQIIMDYSFNYEYITKRFYCCNNILSNKSIYINPSYLYINNIFDNHDKNIIMLNNENVNLIEYYYKLYSCIKNDDSIVIYFEIRKNEIFERDRKLINSNLLIVDLNNGRHIKKLNFEDYTILEYYRCKAAGLLKKNEVAHIYFYNNYLYICSKNVNKKEKIAYRTVHEIDLKKNKYTQKEIKLPIVKSRSDYYLNITFINDQIFVIENMLNHHVKKYNKLNFTEQKIYNYDLNQEQNNSKIIKFNISLEQLPIDIKNIIMHTSTSTIFYEKDKYYLFVDHDILYKNYNKIHYIAIYDVQNNKLTRYHKYSNNQSFKLSCYDANFTNIYYMSQTKNYLIINNKNNNIAHVLYLNPII